MDAASEGGATVKKIAKRIREHLNVLCVEIGNRHPATEGNRNATAYFEEQARQSGFNVTLQEFECLDWQARELTRAHPYSFRGAMERQFYAPVDGELAVAEGNRRWLRPDNVEEIRREIASAPIQLTYGGWGQDGHIAYNQARRHPFSTVSLQQLRASTVRIQENNWDTILALAQRSFGTAYQFVPPMSVTLGLKECLSAAKVRLFSDTGAWKQTALRVALFSRPDPEYPMTLLQEHPDALITATVETASHPISLHPEWDLGLE